MKKKILVVLLVILAMTSVVQLAMISHPKTAEATMPPPPCCTDCYWECTPNPWFCIHWCFKICPCDAINNHVASM